MTVSRLHSFASRQLVMRVERSTRRDRALPVQGRLGRDNAFRAAPANRLELQFLAPNTLKTLGR